MVSVMRAAVLLFVLSIAPLAQAQSGDVGRARELFQSGLDAAHAQHWTEARDAFAQSLALAERPSTLLNLAGAQIQTGQLVEGAASYRRFLEIATGRDAAHRGEAQSALTSVEPRIPHATITVDGLADGDEIRLDGNVLMRTMLGTSAALDPGAHEVGVTRAGRSIASQRFQLAEGLNAEISLSVTQAIASPTEAAQAATTGPMDEAIAVPVQQSDDTGIWIAVGVSIGVAVVVAVVVGVVLATQSPGTSPPYQGNLGDGVVHF